MENDSRDALIAVIGTIAFGVFLAALATSMREYSCANTATAMGMRYNFAMMQGCMIEYAPGKWVPLDNYRVV